MHKGKIVKPLSIDHKPCNAIERDRVIANGGQIYQNTIANSSSIEVVGPLKIVPGGLSAYHQLGIQNYRRCNCETERV